MLAIAVRSLTKKRPLCPDVPAKYKALLFVEFYDQTEFDAVAPRRYKRYSLTRKA